MNENRSFFTTLSALLGTGTVVAFLSWLGFSPADQSVLDPAAAEQEAIDLPADVIEYPAVKGAKSYSALMWDDPFRFADQALRDKEILVKTEIRDTIHSKAGEHGRVMYMVVPIQEGKEDAAVEQRIRRRHAIELALSNQGFSLPFDNRMTFRRVALKYDFTRRDSDAEMNPEFDLTAQIQIVVPTKLYRNKDGKHFALVSWVEESNLGKRPLDTIAQILSDVVPASPSDRDRSSLCILGPHFSNTLEDFIADAKLYPKESSCPDMYSGWGEGMMLCNYSCTATDESLGLKQGQREIAVGDGRIRLIHTIGSDERLVNIMRHELEIRGAWPSDRSTGRMVIFAEQSSLSYVEDLQSLFANSGGTMPVFVPYLKGIATAKSGDVDVLDYLDRSMSRLANHGGAEFDLSSPINLIGILGSDWDDKNVIIQKARTAFPVATFFTFELDARYSRSASTGRNLLIASHYGLRIDGQQDIFGQVSSIPRFRDQYQTSAFVGMSVLGKAFLDGKLNDETFTLSFGELPQDLFDVVGRRNDDVALANSDAYLQPRIFEVGNSGPIQLRSQSPQAHDYLPLRQPDPPPSLHEVRWMPSFLVVGTIIVVILFNTVVQFSTDAREFRRYLSNGITQTLSALSTLFTGQPFQRDSAVWPLVVAVVIGGIMLAVLIKSTLTQESEPILVGEGISIWPSIFGLYIVIALGLASLRDFLQNPARDDDADVQAWRTRLRHDRRNDSGVCKIAGAIVIGFYLTSYFESGFILPPAREWTVRWLASLILFLATLCVLLVASRCLIYALNARKIIRRFDESVETDSPPLLAQHCLTTMQLSIETSKDLVAPACLSVLFIVARSRYWDAWGLDRSWYILIAVPIVTCLIAAIIVRWTAIAYRDDALDSLRRDRFSLLTGRRRGRNQSREILEHSISEIECLNRGPFGPVSRDYLLGAAAIVVGVAVTGPIGSLLNRWLV